MFEGAKISIIIVCLTSIWPGGVVLAPMKYGRPSRRRAEKPACRARALPGDIIRLSTMTALPIMPVSDDGPRRASGVIAIFARFHGWSMMKQCRHCRPSEQALRRQQ